MSCVFGSNPTINMNTNEDLWVVLNVLASAGASPSETFSSQIAAPADVNSLTGGGQVLFGTAAPTAATLKVITYAFTSFTPVTSLPAGGGAITITGSGFALPVTVTIGGVNCGGGAVVNAAGTQITGLTVPAGAGQNLAIVLTTNNLPAKTLSQTFSYGTSGVTGGGGGLSGGGGGGGCVVGLPVAPIALLVPGLLALVGLRRRRNS